jgi:hypothetical protein
MEILSGLFSSKNLRGLVSKEDLFQNEKETCGYFAYFKNLIEKRNDFF